MKEVKIFSGCRTGGEATLVGAYEVKGGVPFPSTLTPCKHRRVQKQPGKWHAAPSPGQARPEPDVPVTVTSCARLPRLGAQLLPTLLPSAESPRLAQRLKLLRPSFEKVFNYVAFKEATWSPQNSSGHPQTPGFDQGSHLRSSFLTMSLWAPEMAASKKKGAASRPGRAQGSAPTPLQNTWQPRIFRERGEKAPPV